MFTTGGTRACNTDILTHSYLKTFVVRHSQFIECEGKIRDSIDLYSLHEFSGKVSKIFQNVYFDRNVD